MATIKKPFVFVIAETRVIDEGLSSFLSALGVPGWTTDADSDAEVLCEVAGKSCYLSFSTDLNKNLTRVGTRNNADYLLDGIIRKKHGSVLEHATMTFAFLNVSRVFTHELVRHRVGAAYSQVSGRYVRTDDIGYFLPSAIGENAEAAALFQRAFEQMESWAFSLEKIFELDGMKDFKRKKELTSAFRRIIGNGQANHVIATFNHRTLRHLIELRTSPEAEEEIRHVFAEVFRLASTRNPALYADAIVTDDEPPVIEFEASKV